MALTDATVIEDIMVRYGIVWDDDMPEQDITVYQSGTDITDDDINVQNIFTDPSSVAVYMTVQGGGYQMAVVGTHEIVAEKASTWTEWTGDE